MEDSPACHFTAPDSLGDNPFPANEGRHAEWETFSVDAAAGLSRLISALQELTGVIDAVSYEAWRVRYAELAPPTEYEPAWVVRMVREDQTHWITDQFKRLLGKAFELFIRGPEDLESAERIVRALAGALGIALGNGLGNSAVVAQWRKWWWPTKAKLRHYHSNLDWAREIISNAQTATSSDRVSDIVEDPGWRLRWCTDSEYARECPSFLQPAKAARLDAIGILRAKARETVQADKPQTREELERCLWPAFSDYAKTVFDRMAESDLGARGRGRRSKKFGQWLKSKCLPAVVDDVCRPIFGQFPVTLRYVAESIGEVYRPEEIVRMRGTVWRTLAEEVIPGSATKGLETRLSITLMEERIPHWESRAAHPLPAIPAMSNDGSSVDQRTETVPPQAGVHPKGDVAARSTTTSESTTKLHVAAPSPPTVEDEGAGIVGLEISGGVLQASRSKAGRPPLASTTEIHAEWVKMGAPKITARVCDKIGRIVFTKEAGLVKSGSKKHKRIRERVRQAIRRSTPSQHN
jgi:hypothetical protein